MRFPTRMLGSRMSLGLVACRWFLTLCLTVLPASAAIPLVDLAQDRDRQVVVDREPGQYLGHPTTVLLEDGRTILCVYPKGHGRGAIQFKRSEDGGRTWSERLPVPENWATSLETPTIHRVVDRDGRKRLIVWSGMYPARLAVSEDDGQTWSPLRPAGEWGGIVVMGSVEPVRGRPGEYLAWFHDDGRYIRTNAAPETPPVFRLYQTHSTDGGLTWTDPRELFASSDVHLCEPGVVRSPDGKEIALLLRENSRRRFSHIIFSTDEGATWSAPRELNASLTGDRHTGRYGPDGRLFLSFRDTSPGSPTLGDWLGWVGTYADLRDGKDGQYRVRLADNHHAWDTAYPGVELLPDGTFVTTTYGYWEPGEKPYVITVRFTLKELDTRWRQLVRNPPRPPGVLVAHSPALSRRFLGSPSLVQLPDGDWVASHDFFGPGTTHDTVHVHGSTDRGRTWVRRAEIRGAFWSSLSVHGGELYLMGTARQDDHVVIRRSRDGGRTWTDPVDASSGRLLADGRYHTAPVPVVEHGGRIWRAFEDVHGPGGWGSNFRAFVLSAPLGADLLQADQWRKSAWLGRDTNWLGGKFGGWLEGNIVPTPNGGLVNLLRVDYRDPNEQAAAIEISADGRTLAFDPATGFVPFPGGCKKFTIRRDPRDGTYWSLANAIPPDQRGGNVERTRNTVALLRSEDLRTWEMRATLLHHPDRDRHAFQYLDWQFEGDDLVALSRTAFADEFGGAFNAHDANFITFHRWTGFRGIWGDETRKPSSTGRR